jgi:quercetin dioxygenase-like cupin family protein
MRIASFINAVCAILVCACATAPSTPTSQATNVTKTTPLILEKNEGERRVWRGWPGHPDPGPTFLLKVDAKNGGSSHFVLGTEDLPPGETIPTHRHPGSDEILFLQTGTARVHLGDSVREVHAGAIVFIPAERGFPSPTSAVTSSAWCSSLPRRASRTSCAPSPFAREKKTSRSRKPKTMISRGSTTRCDLQGAVDSFHR